LTPILTTAAVDVVLFDLAVEGGLAALRRLENYLEVKVVVLGLSEEEAHIVACARAGIAGYVTHDDTCRNWCSASTTRLLANSIAHRELPQRCSEARRFQEPSTAGKQLSHG
jgi:DNA-binding NarL/FixJ family response regulator